MVVVMTATKVYMGRVDEYNGLLVYHDGDFATSPILGLWRTPQDVSGGKVMMSYGVLQGGIEHGHL